MQATVCDICQGEDCPDDGCPNRPTFPTFGSYAFGENVDLPDGAGAMKAPAAAAVFSLAAAAAAVARMAAAPA